MELTRTQITDILRKEKVGETIETARRLQGWMNFYATFTTKVESFCRYAEEAKNNYFESIYNKLPKDKANRFVEYFKNDLPDLFEDVEREYRRVHHAQDRYIAVSFETEQQHEEFEAYEESTLKISERMENEGTRNVIRAINSYIYVQPDAPFEWINVKRVVWIAESKNAVHAIIFQRGDVFIAVDAMSARAFQQDGRGFVMIEEQPHDLGYCPVTSFWHREMFPENKTLKESPIYPSFDKLSRFLWHQNGKDYYDSYAKYEILKLREVKCNYEDPTTGGVCEGGYIRGRTSYEGETLPDIPCGACQSNRLVGAGTTIIVPQPTDPSINNWDAIERVGADVPTLQYNTDETKRLINDLSASMAGFIEGVMGRESLNEQQVAALLEKKKTILLSLARNFQTTHKFILDTAARYMYGDAFTGSIVRYGSEFFLRTAHEMQKQYLEARERGASEYELDEMQKQVDRKANENNARMLQRLNILRNLEPFLQRSASEVAALWEKGLISDAMALLKQNFGAYIERFERENGNLNDYLPVASFNVKIDRINDIINGYVVEDLATTEETDGQTEDETTNS